MVKIVRHKMMVIYSSQSLHYIFQKSSVANECGPKETIVDYGWIWDIGENQINREGPGIVRKIYVFPKEVY